MPDPVLIRVNDAVLVPFAGHERICRVIALTSDGRQIVAPVEGLPQEVRAGNYPRLMGGYVERGWGPTRRWVFEPEPEIFHDGTP